MFGFEEDEADELGSEGRYQAREARFVQDKRPAPKTRHRGWWVLHNCVVHVALGLVPCRATFWFHDWTSKKLNHMGEDDGGEN